MDQNIVEFSRFQSAMTPAPLKTIEAYWDGLRDGGNVPKRSAVDPRGIENTLENAFILERIAPGLARFRLAGMHLVELMGMEVRGMPLSSFFVPEARAALSLLLERGFDGPEIVEISLVAETGFGKPDLKATLLLLPLRSDQGDVSRMLGCLVSDGRIGRTPRRFDLAGSQRRAVRIAPHTAPRSDRRHPAVTLASLKAKLAEDATPKERPYLRLVTSND